MDIPIIVIVWFLSALTKIGKVVQLIKGESSFWINKNNLTVEKFHWQDGYFAVSVSESIIEQVRNYIKNQETHHLKKTFSDEYLDFMKKYNFENRWLYVLAKANSNPKNWSGLKPAPIDNYQR